MNKIFKRISLAFTLLMVSTTTYSQQKSAIDWEADLEYVAKELPEKHFNLFSKKDKAFFYSEIEKIKQVTDNLPDLELALNIQQLLASMGDSHTSIDYRGLLDREQMLPLHLYWFHDGLYVLRTTKTNIDILGCQIISINKIPLTTIADSISSLMTVDNEAIIKKHTPRILPSIQILKYFGFVKDDVVEIEYKTQSGENATIHIKPSVMERRNSVSYIPQSVAFCYKNEKAFFADEYFSDEKIYYLQYNRCWSKELEIKYGKKEKAEQFPSFKSFETIVFNTLATKPIDKLIFDMRFNGGGSSQQGSDFIDKLAVFLKSNPKIELYVVLGRATFSSAILNVLDFKKSTNAVFIGEDTAGKPNHFGELKVLSLPSSQLRVSYSTKYFKYSDRELNCLSPDILIESTFSDFSEGHDPVFETIKSK